MGASMVAALITGMTAAHTQVTGERIKLVGLASTAGLTDADTRVNGSITTWRV